MKVTVAELRKMAIGLTDLNKTSLPISLAFGVNDIIREVNPHLEFVDKKEREIYQKYGTEVNGKIVIEPGSEGVESFTKEATDLYLHEIELNVTKIKKSDLLAVPDLRLQPGSLSTIELILE